MIGPSQQCVYKGAGNFPPAISHFFKYEEAVITLLCSSSDSGCTDGALFSINQQLHRGPLQKAGWNIQRTKHFLCSLEYCNCSRYGPSRCKRWHGNADSKGKLWNQQCITLKLAPTWHALFTCLHGTKRSNMREQWFVIMLGARNCVQTCRALSFQFTSKSSLVCYYLYIQLTLTVGTAIQLVWQSEVTDIRDILILHTQLVSSNPSLAAQQQHLSLLVTWLVHK